LKEKEKIIKTEKFEKNGKIIKTGKFEKKNNGI